MEYTIKEATEIMQLPATTLRYYDKEGLLPYIKRLDSGYRIFSDRDLEMLKIIECLKKTGMSIKDIKQFTNWVEKGDDTLQERYHMFLERRRVVQAQMEELQKTLNLIEYKCHYYEEAIAAGTEAVHHPCYSGS